MEPSFQIDFSAYFLVALGLLTLPLDWFFGAVLAASFHEFFHYLAAKICHVQCYGLYIAAGEIQMELADMNRWEELTVAAAGPAGSFLLLCFLSVFPQLAVCAGVQGMFNLLPIWPLDGGRVLRCVFYRKEKLCNAIELGAAVLIIGLGIYLQLFWNLGLWPVIFGFFVTGKAFLRKIPCNAGKLGVQ